MLTFSTSRSSRPSRTPGSATAPSEHHRELRDELRRRLRGPQRHRLLHGYPMAPLMRDVGPEADPWAAVRMDSTRPLLVGVIPHTLCNPKVRGCGFCTFPHEAFRRDRAEALVDRVIDDIEGTLRRQPSLADRRVDALYIGGGTANLTPTTSLARLGSALSRSFAVTEAEHTLEGAPVYFGVRDGEGLAALAQALGSTRLRISMGIQTFDEARLEAMGRLHLGRREHVLRAVSVARRLGATTSGDLLINLPGQTQAQMLRDVDEAIGLGLDQICIYHLVLFARLKTEWARRPSLLAQLPNNERAFEHWQAVRAMLLERGYVQRTLTNFERADVPDDRRFVYEEHSFSPDRYDAVGFGPAGISTLQDARPEAEVGAVKWCNADTAQEYVQRMDRDGHAVAREFRYAPVDECLLMITRMLPRLTVPFAPYRRRYVNSPYTDFADAFDVLQEAGLLRVKPGRIELTPRGMFFADSVAGLLAWRRTVQLRHELSMGDLPSDAAQMSMMG